MIRYIWMRIRRMPGNPGDPHHHGGVMMDAVGPPLGAHPHGRMGAENGAVEPVDLMPMPPVQEEESAETNGRDCLKNITHVQSQVRCGAEVTTGAVVS
jgi:hypothetical protein